MSKVEKIKVESDQGGGFHPLSTLRTEVEQVFERVAQGFRHLRGMMHQPSTDAAESDKHYRISVELPGMDENDIELSLSGDILVLAGEKRAEREEKDAHYYLMERSYGAFRRAFRLPADAQTDKIEARFTKGVLTISMPREAGVAAGKRKIEISSG